MIKNLNSTRNGWSSRRVFTVEGKQLVLHDHTPGINAPDELLISVTVGNESFTNRVRLSSDDRASLIRMVAHFRAKRADFLNHLFEPAEQIGRSVIVLHVSGQVEVGEPSEATTNVVWLSMKDHEAYRKIDDWLPQFLSLSFEEAAKIAETADRADLPAAIQKRDALLDITHPGDVTSPSALQYLAEAWLLKHSEQRTDVREGIEFHAPDQPDDWLTPFQQPGRPAPTVDSVAVKMGKGRSQAAKRLLDAGTANPNDDDAIREAAEAFLNPGTDQSRTAGGAQ